MGKWAKAPPQFLHVSAEGTITTWSFDAKGDNMTRLTLRQTGWKPVAEWDQANRTPRQGNTQLIETLCRRFEQGPIDKAKEWEIPK